MKRILFGYPGRIVCEMRSALSEWYIRHRTVLTLMERLVLLFPVTVTVVAMAALVCGGCIHSWQWWLSFGVLCGMAVWCQGWKRGGRAAVLLLAMLMLVWIVTGLDLDRGWTDTTNYHLPAIRLLSEGWNPVYQATEQQVRCAMGGDPWEMRLWHVLAMPKSVWVFCAVAYTFTEAPLNLLFPLFPFLFITAAVAVERFFGGKPWWVRVGALAYLWWAVPSPTFSIVESVAFLGAVGLLAGMGTVLRGSQADWMSLVVHSFWMASAKQVGAYSCVLFWVFFSCIYIWQKKAQVLAAFRRLVGSAALIGSLLCFVGVSPYLTMWVNYGHPLYPVYTVDESAYPAYDIAADFKVCNEDAAVMGHVGSFVNAYVSQTLAHAYYKWILGRPDFAPWRSTWGQSGGGVGGPLTSRWILTALLIPLCLTMIAGRRTERILGVILVIALFLVPTELMGYVRYFQWIGFLTLLAWSALTNRLRAWGGIVGVACQLVFVVGCAMVLCKTLVALTRRVDNAYAANRFLDVAPPTQVYGFYDGGLPIASAEERYQFGAESVAGHPVKTSLCNLRLLCRQEPRLRNAKIGQLDVYGEARSEWPTFQTREFKLDQGVDVNQYSLLAMEKQSPDRIKRIMEFPLLAIQVWLVRCPVLLYERFCGLF